MRLRSERPAAPASLAAFALSASKIDLDWADNSESDLVASYNVYRRTNLVVPYTWIGSGISLSDYSDTGLSESTTYYYVVTAVDTSQNESVFSDEAFATTSSCNLETLHVDSIVLAVENAGKGNKRGRAQVTIVDGCGNPVSLANVTGTFTGDFNETVSGTTVANGVVEFVTTDTKKGSSAFTFCVNSVTGSLVYNSSDDVETCDSNF